MRSINAIRQVDNTVIRDPTLINQEFMQFYKLLYTSQGTDMVKTHTFLDKLDIPSLTKVSRDCLEGASLRSKYKRPYHAWLLASRLVWMVFL